MKALKLMLVLAMVLSIGVLGGCGKSWSPLSGGLVDALQLQPPVVQDAEPTTIRIKEKVLFNFDSFKLDDQATTTVTKVSDLMKKYPDTILALEGHTDKYGAEDYNITLSLNRANAVKDALVAQGIAEDRIVKVDGFGKQQLIPNLTNRENRRVLILSVGGK